jgi:hypothetical protein
MVHSCGELDVIRSGPTLRPRVRRRTLIATILLIPALISGCQSNQTRRNSNELISTTSALYYQQVIDNLAITGGQPGSLPFFGIPAQSSDTNTRTFSAGYTPNWDLISGLFVFDKQSATFQGQLANAEAFQLQPVFDPDKLMLMQIAFRMATGDTTLTVRETYRVTEFYAARHDSLGLNDIYYHAITNKNLADQRSKVYRLFAKTQEKDKAANEVNAKEKELQQSSGKDAEAAKRAFNEASARITAARREVEAAKRDLRVDDREYDLPDHDVRPAQWLAIANRKRDLPKCICYSAHCGYVWVAVLPEFQKDFSDFTAAILDLASISSIPVLAPHDMQKPQGGLEPGSKQFLTTPRLQVSPQPAAPGT